MKILFISAFPPNQKTAGQDYSRRLINDLISRGNSISLIYFEYPNHVVELPNEVELIGSYKPTFWNCFRKLFFHPFFTRRFNKEVLYKLRLCASAYDMLYFDFSQVHIYSKYVSHENKVLMCHDVIAQKYTRKGKWQLPWIKKTEGRLMKDATSIVTFSKKDSDFIQTTYSLKSIPVNFYIKQNKFSYREILSVKNDCFCFYGAWNRQENAECLAWFLSEINPKLQKCINFVVIGGGLSEELTNKVLKTKNFVYLGFVDNPIIEIAQCQALIAPLKKGAGVKVKVIDSLTSGTTVIGTEVAFEGILDNDRFSLFKKASLVEDYLEVLNNWENIDIDYKQNAALEFYNRYDNNHFPDIFIK